MSAKKVFKTKAQSNATRVLADFADTLKLAAQDMGVEEAFDALDDSIKQGRTFEQLAMDDVMSTFAMVMRKVDEADMPRGFYLQAMKARHDTAAKQVDVAQSDAALKSAISAVKAKIAAGQSTGKFDYNPIPQFLTIAAEKGDKFVVNKLLKDWEHILDSMQELTMNNESLEAKKVTGDFKKVTKAQINKRLLTRQTKVTQGPVDADGNVIKSSDHEAQNKMAAQQAYYVLQQRKEQIAEEEKKLKDVLGISGDEDEEDIERFERILEEKDLSAEAYKKAKKEIKRLKDMNPASQEASVIMTYLERLLDLPWGTMSEVNDDIDAAQARLDADHYGMDKVKEAIIDRIAVMNQTGNQSGTILCLQGPPGVGKTSIGSSIAEATGRKFVKVSLGGVRDEADIRGHRVTYVGAKQGRIVEALEQAGVDNPLMLLDEIDKMSTGGGAGGGDPTAAMLEVLDPSQNEHFKDHYMGVEYDLSNVMFIATSNYLENVPAPLRDRMEIIELPGYLPEEKEQIAKRYLVPKRMEANGLTDKHIEFTDEAIMGMIEGYTMEAGVRKLEQTIGKVCRKVVRKLQAEGADFEKVVVDNEALKELIGSPHTRDAHDNKNRVGYVNGLYFSAAGGGTLPIEVANIEKAPGKGGRIEFSGNLKEVITGSAKKAYTYVQSRARDFGIKPSDIDNYVVHVSPFDGSTPIDGPSAGAAMTTAIISAMTGIAIRGDVAMTGTITFKGGEGQIGMIGGVREKLQGAAAAGKKKVLIPAGNAKDLEDVPDSVKDKLEIVAVSNIDEVLEHALAEKLTPLSPDVDAEAKTTLETLLSSRLGADDLERAKDAGTLDLKIEFSKGGKPLLDRAEIQQDDQKPARQVQLRP